MLPVFAVVEALEKVLHLLLGDAATRVAYLNIYIVVIATGPDLERHFSFLGVFGCVRQEVIDDFVEFVGVNPAHHALRIAFDGEFQAFLVHERFQTEGCVVDVLHDIALCHDEFQFSGLRFAGFEDLLKQTDHALNVQLHEIIFLLMLGCVLT